MQSATGKPLMAKPAERKQIGGEAIHIGDCQVWVEIYYLDSQTDYREYLPQKRVSFRSDEFILLSSFDIFTKIRFPERIGLGDAPTLSRSILVIHVFYLGVLVRSPNDSFAISGSRDARKSRIIHPQENVSAADEGN